MNHNPDILDQLHHSLDRCLGPRFRRLVEDSITEIEQLCAQLTEQGNTVNHNPDILDQLHHAQPLARGPYRRLINDSIIEIERLRAQLERRDRFEWDCPKCGIHVTSQVVGK